MQTRFLIFLLFMGMPLFLYSQLQSGTAEISGYVTNDSTGRPIENVNVFISGSIFGSSTNKMGYFKIKKVPAGTHEIVASMVGFSVKTKMIIINSRQKIKMNFALKEIMYHLSPLEVVAERPKEWLNDLDKFKSKLLGKSKFTSQCDIKNPEVLEFIHGEDGSFIAKANGPLKIVNYALGYKIDFVLISFIWKYKEGKLRYIYRNRFYLVESKDEKRIKQWRTNRQIAYNGSLRHFLFTLISDGMENSGFLVFHVKDIDSRKPLHPQNMLVDPYAYLLKPSIIPHEKIIRFDNYLKIVYTREAVASDHNINNLIIVRQSPQVSWLKMKNKEVTIDLFGDPEGTMTFELFGYWSDFGVAEMLPKYYIP